MPYDSASNRENTSNWKNILNDKFGTLSQTETWYNHAEIIEVLSFFSGKNVNHMFFPTRGGLDLLSAGSSHEPECIELFCCENTPEIIKPVRLLLETFPDFLSMSYLLIEIDDLKPSNIYSQENMAYEELVELTPRRYINRSALDNGFYVNEQEKRVFLPKRARLVTRRLSAGSFVIFARGSYYNRCPKKIFDAYEAVHNKMTAAKFRIFVEDFSSKALKAGIPL